MTTIQALGTLIKASADSSELTYRLLTYGEPGRTNVGTIVAADASAVTIPDNVTDLVVNVQHNSKAPAGKFAQIIAHDAGLDCIVRCLPTTTGRDMYVEASEGVRPGISVELASAAVRAGRLLTSVLSGAAFVTAPAFPSSLVMAADAGELPEGFPDYLTPSDSTSESTEEVVIDGVTYVVTRTSTSSTTVQRKDGQEPPADNPESPADQPPADNQEGTTVTASSTLGTVQAVPTVITAAAAPADPTFRDVVRLIGAVEDNPTAEIIAALSDIKVSGSGAVGVAALAPGWVGEVWSQRAYQRRYVPLATTGDLTSLTSVGWRWTTKPEVDAWAGNKAAVPSNTPATESVPYTASRLAGAHDVDRAYRDFNVTEFWDSYFRAMTESYARKSDAAALAAYIAAATPVTGEGTLAATSPWSMLIDGALAVIDAGGIPTSAVMGSDLYRAALLTPKDDVIALLELSLGLESGALAGFKLQPASKSTTAMTGKVLVQDKAAVKFKELPGVPIRVEGLDMVKGGVDPGVFGYYAVEVVDADAMVLVSKPAA